MRWFWLICWILALGVATPTSADAFIVLCYHDVQDVVNDPDGMAVSRDNLVAQFAWLREKGYRVVSVDDLLAAQRGERPLPPQAVLLTFDDGYASIYRTVYPLLKAFNYPAVVALVGRWIEAEPGTQVAYGTQQVPRERFMSWDQIREVAASGLVEIASHSYDLHLGLPANPQGNTQPAMTTHCYDPAGDIYETDQAYTTRVRRDFARNAELLGAQLGRRPRIMVWPYGEYNRLAREMAAETGMPITMNLEEGENQPDDLSAVRRVLVLKNPTLPDFVWQLRRPPWQEPDPRRVVHVDLDYVYDADPSQREINLGLLLDRIRKLGVNTVYLQAFADPDGDGVADSLYFPNRHLPVRADLFNRVAWQLRSRTGVQVYAWMPVLAFAPGETSDQVLAWRAEGDAVPAPDQYRRLTPFSPRTRQWVGEIYEDLAKQTVIAGLLFHDDAFLSDFEDAHPEALAAYRAAGLPADIGELRTDAASRNTWTRLKTEALLSFTDELAERVRNWRPAVKTARNLYAGPVLDSACEDWFAQSLPPFLEHYDYTAIMAMPYMEKVDDPDDWLATLAKRVAEIPGAPEKTIFELQSVDWRTKEPVPGATLVRQVRILEREGAIHYGYYPDDFFHDRPSVEILMPVMSLRTYPYMP